MRLFVLSRRIREQFTAEAPVGLSNHQFGGWSPRVKTWDAAKRETVIHRERGTFCDPNSLGLLKLKTNAAIKYAGSFWGD